MSRLLLILPCNLLRLLFERGVYSRAASISFGAGIRAEKKFSEKVIIYKRKDSVLVLLRASESGVRAHYQVLSGVRVNIDGLEVVWWSQPQARSSIIIIALCARRWLRQTSSEDGHVHCLKDGEVAEDAREARYRWTNVHVHICCY